MSASSRLGALLARPDAAALLERLNQGGEEARIVGGAVRNALLGEPVADIDIATTTLPDKVAALAESAGWRAVPTGIAHGTVTVVIEGAAFEVTTLRADVATNGRHAEVAFSRDFAVDAARRDFTINALSLDSAGKVHDYGGGLADVEARRIRFFGEAELRIREDYLRILRFYRFSARYGQGSADETGRAACRALHGGMAILSAERLGAEMLKLVAAEAPHSLAMVAAMAADGVLAEVLPGGFDVDGLHALAKAETYFRVRRDPLRWLAALAVRNEADAEAVYAGLRLTRAAKKRLAAAVEPWEIAESQRAIDPCIYRMGGEAFTDLALLRVARGAWNSTSRRLFVEAALRRAESWTPPEFPIRAKDFAARGVPAGPAMGEALRKAESLWLDQGLPIDASRLAAIADAAARLA